MARQDSDGIGRVGDDGWKSRVKHRGEGNKRRATGYRIHDATDNASQSKKNDRMRSHFLSPLSDLTGKENLCLERL